MASTATPITTGTSQLHCAPQKIKIEDRNNDYDSIRPENDKQYSLSNGKEMNNAKTFQLEFRSSQTQKHISPTNWPESNNIETSLATAYSEFAESPSEIAKLKALLSQEEAKKKQIELERDALETQYKRIRSDKRELEAFTKKRLVATRDKYMRELQERGYKLNQKQIKIDAAFAENAELKSQLAKKEAENERVASAKETLEADNKKMRSSKRKLEDFIKKRVADDQDRYLRGLKLKQVKIDAVYADNAELKSLLANKEAEIDRIANAKEILEAQYKRVRSDKTKLETFTKKSLADSQDNVVRGLRKCGDKLKQKQIKIDAAFAENAELKILLAKKEANNNRITKEKDMLEADYKKSRSDMQELKAHAKKFYDQYFDLQCLVAGKEDTNNQITKEKDVLEARYKKSRSDKQELEAYAKKVYAENCKLKSLLAKKEAKNNQITKENDMLENDHKKRRSDKKVLDAYPMQAPAPSKHKNQTVLKECNFMLK